MKASVRRRDLRGLFVSLALAACVGALATAGCAGDEPRTSDPPSARATPAATFTAVPLREPLSRWDKPGSATLARTLAVAKRYATAVHLETIKGAGIYAPQATWDYWPNDLHLKGATAIENAYTGNIDTDWSKSIHVLDARGVALDEGVITLSTGATYSWPFLVLLAVDGDKVVHEEVFHDCGPIFATKRGAVKFAPTAPGPGDTASAAARAAAAVGEAFATGDPAALRAVIAPGVEFYDTELAHGVRGWEAILAWWSRVPPDVELHNQEPIAGAGWAVQRWTMRQAPLTGVDKTMPGATVIEVRNGKVVRMTLYYNSAVLKLQQ